MRRRIFFVAAIILVAFVLSAVAAAQPTQPHIVNSDFEQGFTVRESPEVEVAVGWDYTYIQGDDRWCRPPCSRPEAKPEQSIVSQGSHSQRWFTTFSRHLWAIHQGDILVEPESWWEFSCDVQAKTSDPPGDLGVFVGIQPWNGNVWDRSMVWGKEQVGKSGWIYDEWVRVSVTAQAYGDKIRVAIGSNPRWAVKENTAYVDNCALRKVNIENVTPQPTSTQCPTPEPCPTCVPGGGCDCSAIREIIRQELDKTHLIGQ